MPSHTYQLFAKAMAARRPVACVYKAHSRTVCPVILGHAAGIEKALTWQVDGHGSKGPVYGAWKCLTLSEIENPVIIEGSWRTGRRHSKAQTCVKQVDLDVNPDSPYAPRRLL